MLLYSWLQTVASALNDNEPGREFHRYPLKDYVAAYNAAMSIVHKYKAEDLIELVKVKLRAGKHQDARQCCSNVLGIVDQIDATGNIIKSLGATAKKVKNKWSKPSCVTSPTSTAPGGYTISSTMVDTQMNGQFTVEPAVPCDLDVYVLVKCVKKYSPMDDLDASMTNIDDSSVHHTAAWHYVLARMLSGDRHAGSADSTAAMHYKLFFEMLGIVNKMEEALENPK